MAEAAPSKSTSASAGPSSLGDRPSPFVELALVLPVFLIYHLGVVFLDIQNATDFLTFGMLTLADGSKLRYLGLTACIGIALALIFLALGRGQAFQRKKFIQIALEGVAYAVIMRLISGLAITKLFAVAGKVGDTGPVEGLVLSCGAGFYEEIAFRVVLFGLGAKLLLWFFSHEQLSLTTVAGGGANKRKLSGRGMAAAAVWAVVSAAIFSGIHYVGALGDPFELKSFLFRFLLGLCLTTVYLLRGFAAAVWTHAVYDIWVLVF